MAFKVVEYNSAMRLGMGYNSYTDSLCVNDVVRKPGNIPASESDLHAARLAAAMDEKAGQPRQLTTGSEQLSPQGFLEGASGTVKRTVVDGQKEVSQVVTWSASFIENSSELLQKLGVSGALSIKMSGVGSLSGKAAFVDSTETKKADVNYVITVNVANQRLIADDVTEFCPIDNIQEGQFTDIYGDCFISGFIEGGEFSAVVSITTADTMKKNSLSGSLELSANISGLDVEGKAGGAKDDNSTIKNAMTTFKVIWSGGGDIRDDSIKEWTLQNLKEVAMSFPDSVAASILTKYTSLRSYHEQTVKGSPLDYENAGVYTASLYDAYSDYKVMWKDIQAMISGLNKKEFELYMQDKPESLMNYAKLIAATQQKKEKDYQTAIEEQKSLPDRGALVALTGSKHSTEKQEVIEKPLPANKVDLYPADVFGLEMAASDCRFEMIKLVREVDAVTKDPKVACDPSRIGMYLSPSVFRLLLPAPDKERLPTLKQWKDTKDHLSTTEDDLKARKAEIEEIKKILENALITPRRDESGTLNANAPKDTTALHPSIQTSLSKHAYKADDYRMQSLLQDTKSISTGAAFFNDLELIESGARPSELRVWSDDTKIKGICIVYTTDREIAHGQREGNPQHALKLDYDEVITELEVHVAKVEEGKLCVKAIAMATSKCNILIAGTKSGGKTHSFSMQDDRQWSFRGLFGFTFTDGFEDLGVVWGKDKVTAATSTVQAPPAKNFLGMGPSLQEKTKKAMSESKPAEHFYLGDCVSTGSSSASVNTFNALDTIAASSQIRSLAFSVSAGRLCGLKVGYSDNKQLTHGVYSQDREVWHCEVKAPIVAAKLTVGKTVSTPEPFVDTVELVCGDENGALPLWPLDVSTIRYLGDHTEADKLEVVSKLTEQAPSLARANWSLRGFYGEESQGLITRLGLIWGCA
ncbi:hypothetical protein NW762_010476 [Fusarium torreyae]|uniref:Jacalin-type lectin domain-containing protein n=1 Tax=Fusarium torreyae TaxID=1237075 RepID=A0A9W8RSV6_9HYPO|nr:hypothetical protein NW762_010476 [Fusarium torreyae]